MKIVTCNIRFCGAEDGPNNWDFRKEVCVETMLSRKPDIICCQEVWGPQKDYFCEAFGEFEWFGMTEKPDNHNPVNSIFYRKDKFRRVSSGGHWLSQTPHIAGSRSWDSFCIRLSNWLRLLDIQSGREFRIVNTHIDHESQPARENQACMLCEDANSYPADFPQILTGDMNADLLNPAIRILKNGGWKDACEDFIGEGHNVPTYNGFGNVAPELSTIGRMDWIFYRGMCSIKSAEIITDMPGGKYPSDHWFVCADFNFG